ncbi:iron ABC transporter permease [Saccharibacillus sp. CPCC 101409]|uniref:FecCD family ABC transporter permease n=1 Tax=Saccharibacillus sp. CPCC 101409 TaxID=3058041 RepID=UPI00267247BB|nr:iron ABC transporter permease [Saccharibacillus sp. CPCC 101409]MDO3408786.1 iron ABC transporter permease [Saccharibacillus sp. CPCC 101409]
MKKSVSSYLPRSFPFKLLLGFALMVLVFIGAILVGAKSVSLADIWSALTGSGAANSDVTIIRELRLPRELGGLLVGSALGVSGAIMQGLTRNPLADPGLLGVTAGANAALAVVFAFAPAAGYFGVMTACFIGAAVGVLFVFGLLALRGKTLAPIRMVLAGAAVSALLSAAAEAISLEFKISKSVSMWTSGGLIGTTWSQLQAVSPIILAGLAAAVLLSRQLTILSLNESTAVGLGLNTGWIKLALYIVITLLAGAAVSLVGNLAFVGLMIPHLVRIFAGTDYRTVLPLSAIFGGTFMVLADTLGRMLNAPLETPVAAIVAVLGLPFFLFIVRKGGQSLS